MGIDAASVVAAVQADTGTACAGCATALVGHEVVLSLMLGYKDRARCVPCLAAQLNRTVEDFLRSAAQNVRRLDCYRAGWRVATDQLQQAAAWPHPRIPEDLAALAAGDPEPVADGIETPDSGVTDETASATRRADQDWDAGSMSCGDLVLELRLRLADMAAGEVLLVTATDPGAPEDLPAWCRLTGHSLLDHEQPRYWIQRRAT